MATFAEYAKSKRKVSARGKTFSEYTTEKLGLKSPTVDDIGPVKPTVTTENDRKWFQKSALFDDGYDFGDVFKTIIGSGTDVGENAAAGGIGVGEKIVDALTGIATILNQTQVGQATQNEMMFNLATGKEVKGVTEKHQSFQDQVEKDASEFIKKDLYDEQAVAKKLITENVKKITGIDAETDSVFGEKSDELAQSVGQLGGTVLANAIAPGSGLVLTGVTAFGGEMESALNQGATYDEAAFSSMVSAGAEVLTEKLTGGIKFGGKALDDALTSKIISRIPNGVVRKLVDVGMDAAGEGIEEVLSGAMSAAGQKLSYMSDKEFTELFTRQDAWDSFIGGAVLGGLSSAGKNVKAKIQGVDSVTGLTKNEQAVFDKIYKDRVNEATKGGKRLSGKDKENIYNSVLNDMEKGYIAIGDIESVLGGETYKQYQSAVEEDNRMKELQNEHDTLYKMKNGEKSDEQNDRQKELKQQLDEYKNTSKLSVIQEQLSNEVSELAKTSKLAESYNEKSRRSQAFEADLTQYDEKHQSTYKRAMESGVLNNTNRTHEFVDLLAKLEADKGVLFDFTNNKKIKETGFAIEGKQVNGYVQGNNIAINIDSTSAFNKVVGHEITHVLEGTELYTELANAVKELATTKGEYDSKLKSITKLYEEFENANIENELTADLIGEYLFTDSDFINRLSAEKPTLFKKIFDEIKYLCKVATAGSKEARQLEKLKKTFEEAYRQKNNTAKDDGVRYSLNNYSEHQIENWKNSKNIIIYENSNQLLNFVKDAKQGNNLSKKMYFGSIPKDLANEIHRNTGIDVSDYNCTLRASEVKKIFKSHGNEETENKRGQRAITENDFVLIPKVIQSPDSISLSEKLFEGKPVIEFTKVIDDKVVVSAYVSKKHLDLTVQTMFAGKKKGNLATAAGEQAPADTPEANVGTVSTSIISNSAENVKEKQLEIINQYNPAPNTYNTWVRSVDDIKTFEEALADDEVAEYDEFNPDFDRAMAEQAIKDGEITVYSSYPIKQGVFVSPSYMEAESYSGDGTVYSKRVPLDSVAWIDITQGQYADTKTDNKKMSLSNANDDIGPVREHNNVYGEDIKLQVDGPVREDIAQGKATTENTLVIDDAPIKETHSAETAKSSTHEDLVNQMSDIMDETNENDTKANTVSQEFIDNSNNSFGIEKPNDYVHVQKQVFNTLKNEGFFTGEDNSRIDYNEDSGMVIETNKKGIKETFNGDNYSNLGKEKKALKLATIRKLPEIIKNGKLIADDVDNYHNKSSVTRFAYIESEIEVDGKDVSVKIDIKKSPQKNKFWVHSVQILEKANEQPAVASGAIKRANDSSAYEDSVPNLTEDVKEKPKPKRFERAVRKIDTQLEQDKADLREDFQQKKAELEKVLEDKNSYISDKALSLYKEMQNLRKGVRASNDLAYFLDLKLDSNELKSTLLKVHKWPDIVLNSESEIESIVREAIGRDFEEKFYELDDLDTEYQKQIEDLEKKAEEKRKKAGIAEQRRVKQQEYKSQMTELIGDTTTWKDKKLGLQYRINTLRRNLRDIVRDKNGKRDLVKADAIYDALQGQYNHNEAELNREANRIKKVYADMNITKAEDTYIQMLGEYRHNPDTKLTLEEVQEFLEKNKDRIDQAKVDKIIDMARETYDNLFGRTNTVLKEQGMREIPYRLGYFPHFTEEKQGRLAKLLNWKTHKTDIPTDIAGLTEQFNPNRSWQSFNKQRSGDDTDYSFMKGLDTYVQGALDWIYHIEDIQKRRAFENHIRYVHSEKGIQEKIDAIYNSEEYDADETQEQVDAVFKEAKNPLNNFVTDFRTQTNTLAGKKSSMDRGVEAMLNRDVYSTMTNISNRVTANMVVGSISSALTNFIPITQSWGEVSPVSSLKAMGDTIKSAFKDDGTINKSDFLTNRLNSVENLYQTTWDKVINKAGWLMESIDSFTSQTVWRSKYLENMSKGMSEVEAIKNADQFAENILAGRSRGNMPTIFNSKNPFIKMATAFQLEVNNQYGYMFKDMPQDMKNESVAKLAKGYATMFIGAWVYNAAYSALTGRDAAFDPIGIIQELLSDLFDDEEDEPADIIMDFTDNIIDELPFVGGILGDGGRIPISSALPYDDGIRGAFEGFINDMVEKDGKHANKEIAESFISYLLSPVAGGQIKKTAQGLSMFLDDDLPIAGSYTDSGKLRFTVEETMDEMLRAGFFGQYASKNARQYFDENRSPLSDKKTQELIDLDVPIEKYWEYQDGLKALGEHATLNEKGDYIANLEGFTVEQKNILINNIADRDEPIDLTGYENYSDFQEFDFATRYPEKYAVLQECGISVSEYKEKYEEKAIIYTDDFSWASNNAEKFTVSKAVTDDVTEYKKYTSDLSNIKSDKDKNGNSISGSAKRKKVAYINSLDIEKGAKLILYKSQYKSDDTYNTQIIEYLKGRKDITRAEKETILTELGFTVHKDGRVTW